MKLRDLPMMSHDGVRYWPPVWSQARDNNLRTMRGEVGILTYVHYNAQVSSKCYLTMEHEGDTYVGSLTFRDKALTDKICGVLSLHLKKAIKEIGDLDLSYML